VRDVKLLAVLFEARPPFFYGADDETFLPTAVTEYLPRVEARDRPRNFPFAVRSRRPRSGRFVRACHGRLTGAIGVAFCLSLVDAFSISTPSLAARAARTVARTFVTQNRQVSYSRSTLVCRTFIPGRAKLEIAYPPFPTAEPRGQSSSQPEFRSLLSAGLDRPRLADGPPVPLVTRPERTTLKPYRRVPWIMPSRLASLVNSSLGSFSGIVDSLRRPAYTGAQRCLPCTALNLGLLAIPVLWLARRRRLLALGLAAVGTAAIWLRGYVVPYTPQFAPRLVASVPFLDRVFHADDGSLDAPGGSDPLAAVAGASGGSAHLAARVGGDADGIAPDDADDAILDRLLAAGVLVAEGEALALADEVHEHWRAEMDSLNSLSSDGLAAEALETAPTATDARAIDGERPGEEGRWIALGNGSDIAAETWLSRPVAIADIAAVRALGRFDLPLDTRLAAARPLRMFLSTCPDCGGRVEETTTATCCGGVTNPRRGPQEVLACADCSQRLFTFP